MRRPLTTSLKWFHPSRIGARVWYCGYTFQSMNPWMTGAYWMQSLEARHSGKLRR